jgi:hypothetical protein
MFPMIDKPSARYWLLLAVAVLCGICVAAAQTPATGAIEFSATARPTGARPEPVRQISFFLLRKSLADIRKDAELIEPPPDLDHFVDTLDLSPELRTWMKKHHTAQLSGEDFIKQLTAADIVAIPELFDAYTKQNGASLGGGIPIPTYKEKDREKDPEKYQKAKEAYRESLRKYIAANMDTVAGLDLQLRDLDPAAHWRDLQAEQRQRVERRAMNLAQASYLAAQADSDLNGHGVFSGLVPGSYWVTTLDAPALAGDVRLHWDFSVSVRAGETARVELSNLNALESANRAAQ